jgi:Spy/CpxP family protein refolding chaperone
MRLVIAISMVLVATTGQSALAQGGQGGGGGGAARMQAALFEGLTLTDAQRAKVDSIESAYRASAGGAGADRQAMRQSRQQEAADLRAVLTPDQQPQFDKNLASIRSRTRARGGMRDSSSGAPPQ